MPKNIKNALLDGYIPVLAFICFLLLSDFQLATDGSNIFRQVLEEKSFYTVGSSYRVHAFYLIEWLMVAGVNFNLFDMAALNFLYGLAIFLPLLLAVYLTYTFIYDKAQRTSFLWLLSLFIIGVDFPAMYVLGTEPIILVPLVYICGLLILKMNPQSMWQKCLLPVFIFLLARTYETNIIPLFLFALMIARLPVFRNDHQRLNYYAYFCILLCVYGIGISMLSILHPRDAFNRDSFLMLLPLLGLNPCFQVFILAITSYLGVQAYPSYKYAIYAGYLLLSYGIANQNLPYPNSLISFTSRTSTLFIPLLFIALAYYCHKGTLVIRPKLATALLVPLMCVAYQFATPWVDFKSRVIEVLNAQTGYIAESEHHLGSDPASWWWAFPLLSVIWHPQPVNAILLNRAGALDMPYDPYNHPAFPAQARYGSALRPTASSR